MKAINQIPFFIHLCMFALAISLVASAENIACHFYLTPPCLETFSTELFESDSTYGSTFLHSDFSSEQTECKNQTPFPSSHSVSLLYVQENSYCIQFSSQSILYSAIKHVIMRKKITPKINSINYPPA